jgi:hypothetical protein
MNRSKLEEILAAQRARRQAAQPVASPILTVQMKQGFRISSTTKIFVFAPLIAIAIWVAIIWGCVYLSKLTMPVSTQTAVPTSTATAMKQANFAMMQVCTNIPDGRLHVRFTPGEGSEVRGYLAEGEAVQVSLINGQRESQTVNGELWLRILSPVEGWSNKIYICEKH